MSKLWKLKSQVPEDIAEKIMGLLPSESHNPHPAFGHPLPKGEGNLKLLAQLLYNRGLADKNQIEDFLNPKYENLHSPFLFKDMQKAVERIWQAIENKEKITIYGDYDADAVTANAVLRQTFNYLGHENITSYIPDRFTEGYGVNMEALLKIKDQGSTLIITVDCGTNSTDAAEFCTANNIDLIITDHHEIVGEKPKALALINPKNPDDNYPYNDITGVGVAFKLACGILSGQREADSVKRIDGWEKWLLDLVAIGTVADCHSLLGENRILVKYGLKVLQKTKWTGLRALITSAALDFNKRPPDAYTLGFVIAPRLNAAGRLEHADIALDLLLETDINRAQEKAARVETINQRRQQITQTVLSEAKEKVAIIGERKVLALVGEGWPKGVMGLVAGKLAEEYYKPVIVLERTESLCTGSARTAGEFNLIEALKFSSEHLLKFGGHKQAAGLSLEFAQFEGFYQKLLSFAELNIAELKPERVLELEAELGESDLSLETCHLMTLLEPFGVDNAKPKFFISQIKISAMRQVGQSGQHIQYQLEKGGKNIAGIAFNGATLAKSFKIGDTIDAAAELMEDGYNGQSQVKLRIVDMRPS